MGYLFSAFCSVGLLAVSTPLGASRALRSRSGQRLSSACEAGTPLPERQALVAFADTSAAEVQVSLDGDEGGARWTQATSLHLGDGQPTYNNRCSPGGARNLRPSLCRGVPECRCQGCRSTCTEPAFSLIHRASPLVVRLEMHSKARRNPALRPELTIP